MGIHNEVSEHASASFLAHVDMKGKEEFANTGRKRFIPPHPREKKKVSPAQGSVECRRAAYRDAQKGGEGGSGREKKRRSTIFSPEEKGEHEAEPKEIKQKGWTKGASSRDL